MVLQKTETELEKFSQHGNNQYSQYFLPSKKINFYIKSFKKFFAGRKILITKEITKIHEELIRRNR